MNNLISIIVPVYNSEKFLHKCISSLIVQSYKDIEIILVDDGSTDNSGRICDQYVGEDSRIRVIHQINMGVSIARRNGVKISRGNYVAFVDADDYLEENFVSVLVENIDESDIVCCNCIDEGDINQPNIIIKEKAVLHSLDKMMDCYFEGMRFAYVIWGKLIKRELIDTVEFINLKYTEDTHMMLEMLSKAKKVTIIPYAGYHYVACPSSAMSTAKLMELSLDNLVTADFLNSLCENLNCLIKSRAMDNMVNKCYIAILAICKEYMKGFPIKNVVTSILNYNAKVKRRFRFDKKYLICRLFMMKPYGCIRIISKLYKLRSRLWGGYNA